MSGFPEFERKLKTFSRETVPLRFVEMQSKATLALDAEVKAESPRDSGRLAASIEISVGSPVGKDPGSGQYPKPGPGDPAKLAGLQFGQSTFVGTDVDYAPVVEYGGYPNPPKGGADKTIGGYSRQAPKGMFRPAVKFVAAKFK